MKFYEIPPEVESKIRDTDARPFVRVVLELSSGDVYIPDSDILECITTQNKIPLLKPGSRKTHYKDVM